MVYTIIWLTLFTVWTGALLALPVLQARELKGEKAPKPAREQDHLPAHAMA